MGGDPRLVTVEQRLEALTQRVIRLEEHGAPAAAAVQRQMSPAAIPQAPAPLAPPGYWAPPPAAGGAAAYAPRHKRVKPLVALAPSRVLAVAGGLILLLGIGFLVRYAFAQGWLGPEARIVLALMASGALATIGVRLERSGDTRGVGQVCTATGAAGAYTAIVAATVGYVLVPDMIGLLVSCGVAAAFLARGVWSRSQWATGLGLGGALAAPSIVNAVGSAGTLALLVVLLAAGLLVTVRRGWPRLSLLSFAVVSPQLWVIAGEGPDLLASLVLVGVCGALFLAACVAHAAAATSRVVTSLLTGANAVSVAATGWALLHQVFDGDPDAAAAWWVAAVGGVHLLVAMAAALRLPRSLAGLVAMTFGLLLTDAAILLLVDGHQVAAALGALAITVATVSLATPRLRDVARTGMVVQLVAFGLYGLTVQIDLPSPASAEALLMVVGLSAGGVLLAALTQHLGPSRAPSPPPAPCSGSRL